MASCGYICPQCEGKGFLEGGEVCDWCNIIPLKQKKEETVSDEEWLRSTHEGKCCGD